MDHMHGWDGMFHSGLMIFWWIILGVFLVMAIIFLLRFLSTQARHTDSLELAKRRLAKGEISEQDYERLKRELMPGH